MSEEQFDLKRGRRRKDVSMSRVAQYLKQKKTIGEIAKLMGISYKTLWSRIKEQNSKR